MKLTNRGKAVLLVAVLIGAFAFGIVTAPFNLDYSQGPIPAVVDTRD
jgi:hypothetical protein